jgi:hypothetical protein
MMDIYRTDWRNIGGWIELRFMRSVGLRTPWGNLIVKSWADRLFSERYGYRKSHFRLFGLCISWVRLRHFRNLGEAIADITPQETPLLRALSPSQKE